MEITIRTAIFEDLPQIYQLVKELAVYEEAGDQVTASLEDYEKDFKDQLFECLVALDGTQIVGMTLYYMTYSTWKGRMLYLEDFVVKEAYRKKRVGQQLFDQFKIVAKEKKARLMKWQVLDWNEPAIKFYEKNNAILEKNWWSVKLFTS